MKAVILAGGLGTRLSEETYDKPKPMVEIGGYPILWHIMKLYNYYGIRDFVICCGYKGYVIKEYFSNYYLHNSDITFDLSKNSATIQNQRTEPWRVTLVDTGDTSMTGGRLLRVKDHLQDDETFCFTYGDGVSNVNIRSLLEFHSSHGKYATVTAVSPPGRFGALEICDNLVTGFKEKPSGDGALINGGFFVLNQGVFDYLNGDHDVWEEQPLSRLAEDGQLCAYKHQEFWQPMDTLRDKKYLQELWNSGTAPWRVW